MDFIIRPGEGLHYSETWEESKQVMLLKAVANRGKDTGASISGVGHVKFSKPMPPKYANRLKNFLSTVGTVRVVEPAKLVCLEVSSSDLHLKGDMHYYVDKVEMLEAYLVLSDIEYLEDRDGDHWTVRVEGGFTGEQYSGLLKLLQQMKLL